MEVNFPEIETTRKLPYSLSDTMTGRLLIDTPNDYIPDGYLSNKRLFISQMVILNFIVKQKNINYMCKLEAFRSI
jgi:hypothetical protein